MHSQKNDQIKLNECRTKYDTSKFTSEVLSNAKNSDNDKAKYFLYNNNKMLSDSYLHEPIHLKSDNTEHIICDSDKDILGIGHIHSVKLDIINPFLDVLDATQLYDTASMMKPDLDDLFCEIKKNRQAQHTTNSVHKYINEIKIHPDNISNSSVRAHLDGGAQATTTDQHQLLFAYKTYDASFQCKIRLITADGNKFTPIGEGFSVSQPIQNWDIFLFNVFTHHIFLILLFHQLQ